MRNNPFFTRLGGKSRLLKRIQTYLPPVIDMYVEPFFGAGWVFWNYTGAEQYVINDKDVEVWLMLLAIEDGKEKKITSFDWKTSEKTFFKNQKRYFEIREQLKDPDFEYDLYELGYEILYLYRSLQYWGVLSDFHTFNKTVPKKEYIPLDNFFKCNSILRSRDVDIQCRDYKDTIDMYIDKEDAFFFLDPPYLQKSNIDRYNAGVVEMDDFFEYIQKIKGKVLVTVSDKNLTPEWKETLEEAGFTVDMHSLKYSSDNLQKYKEKKTVKDSFEYFIHRNLCVTREVYLDE